MLSFLSLMPSHAQVEIGCLKYQLNADEQTATVTDLVSLPEDSIVHIPETITSGNTTYYVVEIGDNAFKGSTFNKNDQETLLQVKRFTIAKTVKRIGNSAFSIPGNINGTSQFSTCALEAITFDEGSQLQELGKQAFGTTCLNEIDLPEGLKTIGQDAFYDSRYLKRVGLSSTIDSIGPRAFAGSTQVLTDITLNEGIRAIADEAFYSNRALKKIVLPASLQTIGSSTFNSVDTVVPHGATPPAIEANTFRSGVTVEVSVDIIDAYRTAPHWSNLNITGGSFTDEQGRKFNIIGKEAVRLVSFGNSGHYHSITIPETETVNHEGNTFTVTEYAPEAFTSVSELHVEKQYTQLPAWHFSLLHKLYLPPSIKDMTLPTYNTNAAQIQLYLTSPTPPAINNVAPFTLWLDESLLEAYAAQRNAWWDVLKLNPFESASFELTRLLSNLQGVAITNTPMDDITIPATITDSEGRSFNVVSVRAYNSYVTSVVIESAAMAIDEREFAELPYLETVVLPEGITRIPDECFYASGITHITLPNSVKEIGQGAFRYATKLKQITLSEGLTTLGAHAFMTSGIETVSLPASLKNVGAYALNAMQLKEISVAEGNANFCSANGVLFSKDMKTLYVYPYGKDDMHYDIPDGTERIATRAFMTPNLTSVRLPESCAEILQQPGVNDNTAFYSNYGNGYKLNTAFQSKPNADQLRKFFGNIPQTVILPAEYYCPLDDNFSYATEEEEAQRIWEWNQLSEEEQGARYNAWESIKSQYSQIGVTNVMTENMFQMRGAALTFALNNSRNGYVVLSAVESLMGKHVAIPEVYNGLPVVGIEGCAFANCDKLESVKLPSSLKFIGEGAFFGCRNLKNVEGLQDMEFNDQASNDRTMSGVFNYAFADCPKLETLQWGGSNFNASMVIGNTALKSVELPDTMMNWTVGDNLPRYTVNDGVVYMTERYHVRIDGTYQTEFAPMLFYYPAGRENTEFTVPDGTREISQDALADSKIEKITLPASLKYINDAAFYRNRSLTEVVMLSDSIEGLPIITTNVATPTTTGYSNTYAFGQRYTFIGTFRQNNYSYYSPSLGYIYDEAYPAFETDWTSQNTVLYVKKRVFDELQEASHSYWSIFKEIRVLSDPTGINETTAQNRAQDGNAWYTLDGRRIEKPAQPGLYIHNSRKIVVK